MACFWYFWYSKTVIFAWMPKASLVRAGELRANRDIYDDNETLPQSLPNKSCWENGLF
jgi:hypothetical protein